MERDLKGIALALIDMLSQNFPGRTEKTTKYLTQGSRCPIEIRKKNPLNTECSVAGSCEHDNEARRGIRLRNFLTT
jgi:hypothetical protein